MLATDTLRNVQLIRWIAVLAVTAQFASAELQRQVGTPSFGVLETMARAGVDLLFLATGFVMFRAARILPMFLLGLAITVTLVSTPGMPAWLDVAGQPVALEFAFGGALAALYARLPPLNRRVACLLGVMLMGAGTILLVSSSLTYGAAIGADFPLRLTAFGLPCAMILSGALAMQRVGVVSNAGLLQLGDAGWCIYLVHGLVLHHAVSALTPFSTELQGIAVFTALAFAVLLAATIGVVLHRRIELPLMRRLRRLVRPQPVRAISSDSAPA